MAWAEGELLQYRPYILNDKLENNSNNLNEYAEELIEIIKKHFDLTPKGIIRDLDLRRPIYRQTSSYGHFGRTDIDLPWERLDKVEILKNYNK